MLTDDDLTAFRRRVANTEYWERVYGHESTLFAADIRQLLEGANYLLAELDRYRAYAGSDGVNRTMDMIEDLVLGADNVESIRAAVAGQVATADAFAARVHEADCAGMEWQERYDALRAAHTWKVATPETMPPPGSVPWLVEVYRRLYEVYWSGFEGVGDDAAIAWLTRGGDIIRRAEGTRFAAMPADPPATEEKEST